MARSDVKEVDYGVYCSKCKYKDRDEFREPCNTCLTVSMRSGTNKPIKFVENK